MGPTFRPISSCFQNWTNIYRANKKGALEAFGAQFVLAIDRLSSFIMGKRVRSQPPMPFRPMSSPGGQKQPRSMKAKQQSWVLRGLRHLQAPAAAHTDIFPEIGSNFFFQRSCCTICEVSKPTNKFSVQKIYDMLPSKVCPPPCFDVLTPIVWSKT